MSTRSTALAIVVWAIVVLWLPSPALGACAAPVAVIVSRDNAVHVREAGGTTFVPAVLNAGVCEGDTIRVGEFGRATIAFVDSGLRLTIEQNTEFSVHPPRRPGRSLIDLIRGAILFFSRQPRSLDVQTPFVNAAVEGTEFVVRVDATRAEVAVLDGTVAMENEQGRLVLTGGESGQAFLDQAPQRVEIRPQDAVRWALYYEPLLPADSLPELERVPAAQQDAAYFVRRAGALLAAGRPGEARQSLDEAGRRDAKNSDAYALTAVIDVAENEREAALGSAREAVALAPDSVTAALALSYALQSDFQLEAARDALLRVIPATPAPEHALVLARLAELRLSLGDVDGAVEAARRSADLAPGLARSHAVVGFAELARVRTKAARAAFERAIELESRNPLAHLGLGLAKIRDGDLDGGRAEIETAAALDITDPIVRSYLGKAYFEEKRDGLSAQQLALAKELDPRDPTPWLYDAIRKQTENRPVEALQDLEKSIELNDNRAVYRSRFLLDADLAARSASLGRIYRDLGFEQMALVEGWKSLAYDPGDFSGHRLLADTYSALPRHEVARVSELLQAQLLQPLNLVPMSPRLAETNLFILPGAGPGEPAFNEFNSLFARNRIAAQFSGVAGERSVLGDELTFAGIWNNVSFSLGQFHYDTDGFRPNNAQDRDLYNAFVQIRLTESTSVQGELRTSDSVTGDLNLLFNREDFSPDERIDTSSRLGRVGVRHVFGPTSQVIASLYFSQDDFDASASAGEPGQVAHATSVASSDNMTVELRHLYRSGPWNVSTGFGHFRSSRDRNTRLDVEVPFPPFFLSFEDSFSDDPSHTNVYAYSSVDLSRLTLSFGASGDFYDSLLFSRNQFNPKLGLIWSPWPRTTVRAAALRTLTRTLVASQTIEPTQVGGFNQFFQDDEGEEAWRYGLAFERKLDDRWFAGVEYSWRNLTVPIEFTTPEGETTVSLFDRSEQFGRSYVYWTVNPWAATVEYLFERFDRVAASSGSANILDLRTHRVPVGVGYFAPRQWFANGKVTYVHQRGEFAALGFPPRGDDSFWVVDTTVGYRLPKRYGRISLEARNLFDTQFQFQDTDPGNPLIKPGRLVVATFTVGQW
jgi:tetratricopeptide (TPR) repeat protein